MTSVGARLGRFRLERQLGAGSYGAVYEATDTTLDVRIALKVLHGRLADDPVVRERFRREIVLARRVVHPGVCRVFDLHEDDGALAISMELLSGRTLLAALEDGALTQRELVVVLRGICQALAAAHDAGVVHRDLKPANILLRQDGRPVLFDFGTAFAADVDRLTDPGTTVGSLRFIAPEVLEGGAATPTADLYAVGMIGYAALAGGLPYSGVRDIAELVRRQQTEPARLAPDLAPPSLRRVVERALARDPRARFATAAEMDATLAVVERELSLAPSASDAPTLKVRMPNLGASATEEATEPKETAAVSTTERPLPAAGGTVAGTVAVAPPAAHPDASFAPPTTWSTFDRRGSTVTGAVWGALVVLVVAAAAIVFLLARSGGGAP